MFWCCLFWFEYQVMKLLCYSAKLIAGLNAAKDRDLAKRFATISSKISGARATLRLIDDIPMLQYTIDYGLGRQVQWPPLDIFHIDYLLPFIGGQKRSIDWLNIVIIHQYIDDHKHLHLSLLNYSFWIALYFNGCVCVLKEPDAALSFLGVIANAIDTFYYPVEKICWLAEHNCLSLKNPDRWDTISSIFWVLSIYLNWMRCV